MTRTVLLSALLLLVAAPVAADSWYQHYAQAERALAEEDWDEAVRQLTEALQRRGDSGAEVRTYGMKFTAYFPYLKLGIAYLHLGEHEAALRAFETEEQLGAIHAAPSDLRQLQRYRDRTLAVIEAETRQQEERVSEIVRSNLTEAEGLERQGRLEQAMQAAGRALAVAPDDQHALATMERLRTAAVQAERERHEAERSATLLAEGRTLLNAGQAARASSLLRRAQALRPSAEGQRLLEQAQAVLARSAVERDGRSTAVSEALKQARRLHDEDRVEEALEALQAALAVEPDNGDVLALQRRLHADQEQAEHQQQVARALGLARAELAAGRFESSLAAANRVLALEPGNAAALEQVRHAYREISLQLLGRSQAQNIPPAIRFADLREDRDGVLVEVLRQPRLRMTGVIIDDSPVTVAAYDRTGATLAISVSGQSVGEYTVTEFVLTGEVPVGTSAFRIVATDGAGLTSSSEYAVLYERPLMRNPLFAAALAGLPACVLVIVLVRRRRRRRRLLRRRFNPFIAGAPVLDDRLFYGREQLIERILETIHNNSLLLHGERRIGKTSLQHHLHRRLQALDDPDYVFYPVYVDLQGTPEHRFFATLAEDVFQELEPVLEGLLPASDPSDAAGYGHRELVRDLRAVLATLERRSTRLARLVLLIDEVDELNDYDPRINQRLRSLFMKSFADSLVAVVSGVEIRKQWEKEASPWFNFFEEIEVQPISRDAAEALITAPLKGVLRIEPAAVDRIIELTGCKPYPIQRLCIALVNRVHEHHRRRITAADVDAVQRSQAS